MKKDLKIVCLGGGVGTVNLLRGLKNYSKNISVVVSMADDGGSAGRLRRLYSIPPPGDLINCIAAMSNVESRLRELLLFRFAGNRYGSDRSLPGQKLGNLILVALTSLTGDFYKGLEEIQRLFKTSGRILPSTVGDISIWAKTSTGEKVYREENIDLGRFSGKIDKLYLIPPRPTAPPEAIKAIATADIIIAGPGDLYTTVLPVLLVPQILKAIKRSCAKKVFVVNVANKSFETPNYIVKDFENAIIKHCGTYLFDYFLINSNISPKIPKEHSHQYRLVSTKNNMKSIPSVPGPKFVKADVINEKFPLYHDEAKLASKIINLLK